MSSTRNELKGALQLYVSETFMNARIIKNFSQMSDQWELNRKLEVKALTQIMDKASNAPELKTTLTKTRAGLKEVGSFLRGVEMLAVTSARVFEEDNPVQWAENRADLDAIVVNIIIATNMSPLLTRFKRDNEVFFSPDPINIQMMLAQLQLYIDTINSISECFRKSSATNSFTDVPKVSLRADVSEKTMEKMLSHINMLSTIRMNKDFRVIRLFQDRHQVFRDKLNQLEGQMQGYLSEMEGCADQLETMNKGAKISGVVTGSVGVVTGVASVAGFVFAPFTGGASIALAAVAIASGVGGVATTVKEQWVNKAQTDKAKETLCKLMKDAGDITECQQKAIKEHFDNLLVNPALEIHLATAAGSKCVYDIFEFVGDLCNAKLRVARFLKVGDAVGDAVSSGGKIAAKLARRFVAVTGVASLGLDIYSVVTDSIALSEGSETEMSLMIRALVSLWRSELESWKKIRHSLDEGEKVSEEYQDYLEKAFYTEK